MPVREAWGLSSLISEIPLECGVWSSRTHTHTHTHSSDDLIWKSGIQMCCMYARRWEIFVVKLFANWKCNDLWSWVTTLYNVLMNSYLCVGELGIKDTSVSRTLSPVRIWGLMHHSDMLFSCEVMVINCYPSFDRQIKTFQVQLPVISHFTNCYCTVLIIKVYAAGFPSQKSFPPVICVV